MVGAAALVDDDLGRRRASPLPGAPTEREERGAGDGGQVQGVAVVSLNLHGTRGAARVAGREAPGVAECAAGAGPLRRREREGRGASEGGKVQRVASIDGARGAARVAGGKAPGVAERAAGAGPLGRRAAVRPYWRGDSRGGRRRRGGRGHGCGEGEEGEGSWWGW